MSEIRDINEKDAPKVEEIETDEQIELDDILNDNYDDYLNGEEASEFKYSDDVKNVHEQEIEDDNKIKTEVESRIDNQNFSENSESIMYEYHNKMENGELTKEDKEKMVYDLKELYNNTDKKDIGNSFVPEKAEYLGDPPIGSYKDGDGKEHYYCNYNWPENSGFEGKPSEVTPQVGDRFNRVGGEGGTYVSPEKDGCIDSSRERSIPYHFKEENITDEPSYHTYEVKRDFSELEEAINSYNNLDLTPEELEGKKAEFREEFNDFAAKGDDSDLYEHEVGKTYEGEIASAFEDENGGGTQWELPMSVKSLRELGMIDEI